MSRIASDIPAQEALHKGIEVAVEHRLDVAGFLLGAMILDQRVGMQVVGSHLAAEVGLAMRALEPSALSYILTYSLAERCQE